MTKIPSLVGRKNNRWLFSDGTWLPVVAGGIDNPPSPPPPAPPAPAPPEPGKSFTQDDITRIATREKAEGRQAGINEILKELGVTDLEEGKTLLKRIRDAEDAQKTQAQKDAEAALTAKAEADKARKEAALERLMAKTERALLKAGVPDTKLEKVAKLVSLDSKADDAAIAQAVEDVKKDFPELFTGAAPPDPGKNPPKPSDPGGPPRPPAPTDSKGQARSLLESRHPKLLEKKG